jgi:hypothetical protein
MSFQKNESYNWPSGKPVWTLTAFFTSIAFFCLILSMECARFKPLQQYWLPYYLSANIMPKFGITDSSYRLLRLQDANGDTYLPTDDDVQPGLTLTPDNRRIPFVLTDSASEAGRQLVLTRPKLWHNADMSEQLRTEFYGGLTLTDMLEWPAFGGLVLLVSGFVVALPQDRKRTRIRKYGRRIRGPEEVTAAEFNYRNHSDGVGFVTLEKPTLWEKLCRLEWQKVRLPRTLEDNHIQMMGDSGAGKSTLIRQVLMEIHARQETAIVYDPALEFTGQFYSPERGDVILNPLDQRMPYWSPSDEITRPSEALTLAAALFPESPRDNPFFVEGPRKIFAHLLSLKLSIGELIWCLSREEELDRRLKGTELAALVYPSAGQQRGGILASLSMVADSLKLLRRKHEVPSVWSAADWSLRRQGWIFLTSLPSSRQLLRPLISMWLDMLILRLMNEGSQASRPVWFVLDELASLHHLPQLHTAITENRKSGNPMVLGFQGRSQLEVLYGHLAEAIFSQPATKFFLRTSEPNAAQWISGFIGNVEIERLRETRSDSHTPPHRETRSYQMEHDVHPLIMKEEISGLDTRHAFMKCGNLVVRLSFPYIDLPNRRAHFLERRIDPDAHTYLFTLNPPATEKGQSGQRSGTGDGTPPSEQSEKRQQEPPQFMK